MNMCLNNNPYMQMIMEQFVKTNPQAQRVSDMLKNGANPKELFYKMCKERGIDPNTILSQLNKKGGF